MKYKLGALIILSIILISFVSAEASYCCEKTDSGAWCQNAPESDCDEDYRSVPTSCEATSYCKTGVCINTKEGTCLPNTPQKVCENNDGVWDDRNKEDIPQCQLGCCLIGEQAAFVTQTRCKKLSSIYGLEVNYRTDIQNEIQCIASAKPKVKGACVYEKDYEVNCELLTKKECQEIQYEGAEFHEGFLCSATELATICGPRGGTTCVPGKDEIYFLDTCGNLANVYDSSKLNDENYWTYVAGYGGVTVDCSDGSGSKNSKSCGDCDYYSGTTCKEAQTGSRPDYGNYICKDLACEYDGERYEHGETWCADAAGIDDSLVGSRHFRLVCYNGEVSVEPCAEFRQEVCVQSSVNEFKTATCRANMWQDCYSQTDKGECENKDKRDCQWAEGNSLTINSDSLESDGGSCIPLNAPGFDFWEAESDSASTCSIGDNQCVVFYTSGFAEGAVVEVFGGEAKKVVSDWECVQECQSQYFVQNPFKGIDYACIEACPSQCVNDDGSIKENWLESQNNLCTSLGDCGVKKNYIGEKGYHTLEDSFTREYQEEDSSDGGLLGGLGGLFG